jgi:hypothetical protein
VTLAGRASRLTSFAFEELFLRPAMPAMKGRDQGDRAVGCHGWFRGECFRVRVRVPALLASGTGVIPDQLARHRVVEADDGVVPADATVFPSGENRTA